MPGRLSIYDDASFKHDIAQTLGTFKDELQHLVPNYNTTPAIKVPIFTSTKLYTTYQSHEIQMHTVSKLVNSVKITLKRVSKRAI